MLLEVHADASEQHIAAAHVGVVGEGWRVDREERDVVRARHQLDRQRVVAQTAAAVHPSGTCGDREDPHECSMLNAECSMPNAQCSMLNAQRNRDSHWALGIDHWALTIGPCSSSPPARTGTRARETGSPQCFLRAA